MLGRSPLLLLGLSAAVGVPYLMNSSGSVMDRLSSADDSSPATHASAPIDPSLEHEFGSPQGTAPLLSQSAQPLAGYPVRDLGEIFNFDVSPAWIMGRWPRVSTRLANVDLQGYRVPLVTGTAEYDLAGALTYYFDPQQKLQRITFYGTTGDARQLVALLATRHDFLRQTHNDPSLHLYQVFWNGKPVSELQVRPARVVQSGSPHARFELALVLERPAKG